MSGNQTKKLGEVRRRIEALLDPSRTAPEIARKVGCNIDYVHGIAKLNGIELTVAYQGNNQYTYSSSWTAERVAELKRLYVDQGLSQAEVSARMGVTRNSVIGKVNRLKLQRGSIKKKPRKPTRINTGNGGTKSRAPTVSPDFVMPKPQEFDIPRKSLAELELGDCRWPVDLDDEKGFGFCALDQVPGLPYCHEHCLRAYQKTTVKSDSPAQVREAENA